MFSRIYLVPFCSSKLVLSFKFSLREISFAPIVHVEKHQIKEHGFLYLLIKQIVSLIELKMQRLINYWTNTCKFKIDKKHTQWGSLEQSMTLVKINSWKGFIVSLIYHLNFVKKIKCKLETAFDLSFNIALIWLHITGNTALYMSLVHCN